MTTPTTKSVIASVLQNKQACGNTTIPDVGYVYNVRERLHSVVKTQDGSEIQSNRYDFAHRRIGKTASISTTYFLYGQTGLLAEYQSNGDFVKGYGYYPKTSYTTNPVYTLRQNGASYEVDFYHNDYLATPQKLTNSTGVVSWAMESNAFGEVTIKTQTTKNNLRFPGQYADSEIGLSQNYHRDYAPSLGRYMENDPIGRYGGINFYLYTGCRPLHDYDSLGLFSIFTGNGQYRGTFDKYTGDFTNNRISHGGVTINLKYNYHGSKDCFLDCKWRWIQTVTTNQRVIDNIPSSEVFKYNDPYKPDDNKPYYFTTKEYRRAWLGGKTWAKFLDQPKREWPLHGFPVYWHAELCPVCVDANDKVILKDKCLYYGFSIKGYDITTEEPHL